MPLRSDPRRLPRRNHYQEGPGFLFLATQGGRPPRAVSQASPAATVRRRRRALREWASGGSIMEVIARAGCSRATLFRWRDRIEARGIAGLLDRPRPGDHSDLDPALERAIILVRLLSYFWATLQAEVLDRQYLSDLAAAEAAVTAYATYYNYHRLHGAIDWRTPAERFDGTPFIDRGFEHVPSLAPVADLLSELLVA